MSSAGAVLENIDYWGKNVVDRFRYYRDIVVMAYVSLRAGFFYEQRGRRSIMSVVLSQVYFTGCEALPLVGALGLIVGGAVIINASALSFLGTTETIVNLMLVAIVRELGPMIVALILIARSGTAVATELGNMKVNGEIDALNSMAINPYSFIVFPRLVAGVLCSICLTFYFNVIALIGGFWMTQLFHDIPFSLFRGLVSEAIGPSDIMLFLSKNILNGASIFAIACYEGLNVGRSAPEVPKATTRAVLKSITVVSLTTLVATIVFYRHTIMAGWHL